MINFVERDQDGVLHVVGLSGGKDSTAMALRLAEVEPRPYTYVCTPTGDELPEMFEHWKRLGDLLGKPLLPVTGGTLKSICAEEKMLPNFRARFCTRRLKIEPWKAWLLKQMPAVSYVGLRADEDDRGGIDHGGDIKLNNEYIAQRYPLREWGWGEGDVLLYLQQRGVIIPERTDCARCFFQRLGEWWRLWYHHPDIFDDAVRQEEEAGHTFRTPGRDTWPTDLKSLREKFIAGYIPKDAQQLDFLRSGMCRVCTL